MLTETLIPLFERDFKRLEKEISAYTVHATMWKTTPSVTNSAGNLVLHLCGNLQHFIGAILGNTGYVRDREFEFSGKDLSQTKLLEEVKNAHEVVIQVLQTLSQEELASTYSAKVFNDQEMKVSFFLVHLQGHLNYHLGQINYHRRLLDTPHN